MENTVLKSSQIYQENYLNWFAREGFPSGELGQLLALMQELDHNGLKHLLDPLRNGLSKHPIQNPKS